MENELSSVSLNKTRRIKHLNPSLKVYGLSNVNEDQEVHYLIYRIDNTVNGKYYIGQHETIDVMDGYDGSGHYLNRAEKKYGISSFIKTILYDFSTFEEMNRKEKELVQLSNCFPYDPMSYNLKEGGNQGRLSDYSLSISIAHRKVTWSNRTPEERKQFSDACRRRTIGENNPMYGRDWRDGKSKEELMLHRQRISNSHRQRTPEQKRQGKEKERISKENRPQYLKDIHHQKCSKHAKDNWNDPVIRQKILSSRANKPQEEKDIINRKRSTTVHKYWDNHPEERQKRRDKYAGSGNGMYGRRKMRMRSNHNIKVLVKQEDIQKYLDMGYEFTQNYNKQQYENTMQSK